VAEAERDLGLKVDPRRYVNESLRQISASATATPAGAELHVDPAAPQTGLLSRVLGGFGRPK
jgi:hypothetical protein